MQVISTRPFQITPSVNTIPQSSQRKQLWSKQDNIKYAVYLNFHFNQPNISSEYELKSSNFYRQLSIFVQTKNPNQCRIYHKKMIEQHTSINSLLSQLKADIPKF